MNAKKQLTVFTQTHVQTEIKCVAGQESSTEEEKADHKINRKSISHPMGRRKSLATFLLYTEAEKTEKYSLLCD